MALRVADPRRVRGVGIVLTVGGVTAFEEAGAHGPVAWAGFLLLAVGLAVLDGVSQRRLGPRQIGLASMLVGTTAFLWSALVVALLALFGLPVPGFVYVVLALSVPVVVAGAWLLVKVSARRRSAAVTGRAARGRARAA